MREVAFVAATKYRIALAVETRMSKTTYIWNLQGKPPIASFSIHVQEAET